MEYIAINLIKTNPSNPRIIRDDKFLKLVKSIQDFPQMLELRPIVVNDDLMVLGGNMRLKACKEAGLKEVPIIKASNLSVDQQSEFIIKDNVGFGEWDWQIIQNDWDIDKLADWGLDVPKQWSEPEPVDPSGYENLWFVNIQVEDEENAQQLYNEFVKRGLIVKIIQ